MLWYGMPSSIYIPKDGQKLMYALKAKTLIALGGTPFTGKTTIGRKLQTQLAVPFIPVDFLRVLAFGKTTNHQDDPRDDARQLSRAYPMQSAIADALLSLGDSLIIEGTLSRRHYHDVIASMCAKHGAALKIIMLAIPEEKEVETITARAQQRCNDDPSGATSIDDYFRVKNRFEWPTLPHLNLDTTMPLETCIDQCIEIY
jgi:predicted kinase